MRDMSVPLLVLPASVDRSAARRIGELPIQPTAYDRLMLIGRALEQDRCVSSSTPAGPRLALLVRGEAGVGKSALLDHAKASAPAMRVVEAVGVESESTLPFAALATIAAPLVDHLARPAGAAAPRPGRCPRARAAGRRRPAGRRGRHVGFCDARRRGETAARGHRRRTVG